MSNLVDKNCKTLKLNQKVGLPFYRISPLHNITKKDSDLSFCTVLYQLCFKKSGLILPVEILNRCLSFSPSHRFMRNIDLIPEFDYDMDLKFSYKSARQKKHRRNNQKQSITNFRLKKSYTFR